MIEIELNKKTALKDIDTIIRKAFTRVIELLEEWTKNKEILGVYSYTNDIMSDNYYDLDS